MLRTRQVPIAIGQCQLLAIEPHVTVKHTLAALQTQTIGGDMIRGKADRPAFSVPPSALPGQIPGRGIANEDLGFAPVRTEPLFADRRPGSLNGSFGEVARG